MTCCRWVACAITAALVAGVTTAGASAAGSPVTLNWYTAPQNGGSFQDAARACTDASRGRYRIQIQPLPADASQQREQLVRRLAAHDSGIDLISMDVIWTAEFAEAGWVKPWPNDQAASVAEGTIPAVLQTGQYRGRMYAAPLDATTQLLWYRKDLVPTPPETWAELVRVAESLPPDRNRIELQAARYEGLTVWFNSLLASAGGSILDDRGKVALATSPTDAALNVMHSVGASKAADPSLSNSKEDEARLAFQSGNAAFMTNYTFVYPSIKKEAPDLFRNLGIAPWPRVNPDEPAHVTLGGFNLGVASYGGHKDFAFQAARCMVAPQQQVGYATKDGLPPVSEATYDDPRVREAYPYADLLLQTFRDGSARPASPAYNDISLAVQNTLHPPASIDPKSDVPQLRSQVDDAINSRGVL